MNAFFKWVGIAFWVLLSLVIIGMAWAFFVMNCPPFNLQKLDRLRVGMSEREVHEVLGEPSGRYADSWIYSRSYTWPMVHIYFDANGKLTGHHYDY